MVSACTGSPCASTRTRSINCNCKCTRDVLDGDQIGAAHFGLRQQDFSGVEGESAVLIQCDAGLSVGICQHQAGVQLHESIVITAGELTHLVVSPTPHHAVLGDSKGMLIAACHVMNGRQLRVPRCPFAAVMGRH